MHRWVIGSQVDELLQNLRLDRFDLLAVGWHGCVFLDDTELLESNFLV
jgi:hypothetical protein